ncbi:hypothetical protein KY290_017496 [Solanum tuberosum]|uniref:Reverse transcriptase zinc-binding domain-containing protein n=1 Tax=Solanum tuberosum TaxID=4113 RepID=A0ABQ7VDJ7_SOLTU|nr:hypothetical protein KY290_017496 [Solanum tuberosum]
MWNKYCKRHRPQVVEWRGGSQVWKYMLQARDDMDQEIWWEVRNGHSSIWYDNWTQLGSLNYWLPISHSIDENFEEVKQFKEDDGWNYTLIENMCTEQVSQQVHNVLKNVQWSEERDKPWWMPNQNGKFSVKSAWEIFRQRKEKKENIMCIWEKGIPFRISFLLWRIWFQRIPIGEVLETFQHLFMQCPISKDLWSLFAGAAGVQGPFVQIKQTLDKWWKSDCVAKLKPLFRAVPIFIIWKI